MFVGWTGYWVEPSIFNINSYAVSTSWVESWVTELLIFSERQASLNIYSSHLLHQFFMLFFENFHVYIGRTKHYFGGGIVRVVLAFWRDDLVFSKVAL